MRCSDGLCGTFALSCTHETRRRASISSESDVNGQQSGIQLAFRNVAGFAGVTLRKHPIDQFLKRLALRKDVVLAAKHLVEKFLIIWLDSREDVALTAVFCGHRGFAFGSIASFCFARHGLLVLPSF
jgi:hypothetical protein